jgi:dTDP-4-amino-4,6-dideoxygalactose transaminase
MDEMQAAILRVKLPNLDAWLDERSCNAAAYRKLLPRKVRPVGVPDDLNHLFVVRVQDRTNLMEHLHNQGIETKVHFPVPLHLQTADWGDPNVCFPLAEEWCGSVLSLPCYPGLSFDEIERICGSIADWTASHLEA